jgi:hypothetical protein
MSWSERALRFSKRVYEAMLVVYPKKFRDEYGARMVQVFGDACRQEWRRGATPGLLRFWVRVIRDLAATALSERSETMKRFLLPVALVLGLLIALVDSSPGWDDTGVSAAAVVATCGLLSAVHPRRPWFWALVVGGWIPAFGIALHQNYESLMALGVAFVGAYAGMLVRKSISAA